MTDQPNGTDSGAEEPGRHFDDLPPDDESMESPMAGSRRFDDEPADDEE